MDQGEMIELMFDRVEEKNRVEIRIRKVAEGSFRGDLGGYLYLRFQTPVSDKARGSIEWVETKKDADYFAIGFVFADAFSWLVALHRATQKMFK